MSFTGEVAVIESAFGTTGKFRLTVPSKTATFIHIHTVLCTKKKCSLFLSICYLSCDV